MIPQSGGLHEKLMQELHNSCYATYVGVSKMTLALLAWVWWPNLALDVECFIVGYAICWLNKDVNMQLAGLLQLLPAPSSKFEY